MEKTQAIELVKRYAEAISQELSVKEVILFGSYISECVYEDSNIDIAVVMHDVAASEYLSVLKRLCVLRTRIDPSIEPHLMLETGDNGGFLQEVQRTGEVIYRAA